MLYTHPLDLLDLSGLTQETADEPAPRPALAGGSSRRPPDDRSGGATIIPFPREPRRTPAASPPEASAQPAEGRATDGEPQWPHWMAHVLTRYRAPDGSGGAGVFI